MQWSRYSNLRIMFKLFFLQNNQYQLQTKLVSMVKGNDTVKQNYWPYPYLAYIL